MTHKQRALNLLFHSETYPGLIQRKPDKVRLILWKNNTLGTYSSWTFFEENGQYFVRQIVWKQCAAYNLKEPETYGSEIITFDEVINSILQALDNIDFDNLESKKSISIDGIRFGVISQGKHIEWWEESNSESELTSRCLKVITALEKSF